MRSRNRAKKEQKKLHSKQAQPTTLQAQPQPQRPPQPQPQPEPNVPVISKIELMEDEDDVEREEGAEIMGEDALRKEDLEGEQAEDGEDGEDEGNLSKQHEELVSTIFSEQEARAPGSYDKGARCC